jgi:hypothetical protein
MSILADIRRELFKARQKRGRKRSLSFPEPRPVILVGNWHAYAADRVHEAGERLAWADLSTFEGCDVKPGPFAGIAIEWQS